MKTKQQNNLTNFKKINNQDLNNIVGGFALIPLISVTLMSLIAWKLFASNKGSLQLNGIGEAKWDKDEKKATNATRIIYYPY